MSTKTDLSSTSADEFVFADITEKVVEGPAGPVRVTDPLVCDFCMDVRVEWNYPADSFKFKDLGGSLGWWGACDLCSALVEEDDRKALAGRSIRSWRLRHGDTVPEPVVTRSIREIQDGFFRHRTGPRKPVGGNYGMGQQRDA